MTFSISKAPLLAFTLLFSAGFASAADTKASAPQPAASTAASAPKPAASKAPASAKSASSSKDAQRKAAAKVKQVDINSASKEELKTLPGIKDAEADKIIAGRPYGSKAWLVTNKIIDAGVYEGLKGMVIAKQPYKDASKNAEIYKKK